MSGFDQHDARTWDANQRAVYETGHREGESCRDFDWTDALENVLPDGVDDTPSAVAAWITEVQRRLAEVWEFTGHDSRCALLLEIGACDCGWQDYVHAAIVASALGAVTPGMGSR